MKDLHNNIKVAAVLDPALIDSDTTTAGEVIDTQGFDSLEFVVQSGNVDDGDFAVALAESDEVDESGDLVDETVVAAGDLIGSLPTLDDDSLVMKVGYRGLKRYVRLDIVSTSTSDGGVIGAIAVQEGARNNPVE